MIFLLSFAAALAAEIGESSIEGEVRAIGSVLSDFPVDAEGTTMGQGPVLDTRVRLGWSRTFEPTLLTLEGDAFTGQFLGDTWDIPGDVDARHRERLGVATADSFRARKISMTRMLGSVQTQMGLTTSHWGLGMVANDGAHDPWFGRTDFGDRVLRIRGTTRPVASKETLYLTAAIDRVVEDDMAKMRDGQAAWQGIVSLLNVDGDERVGGYMVYRYQYEIEDDRLTKAGLVDLTADQSFALSDDWKLRIAAEAAGILGWTNRATTYNATDGVGVLSHGATALVGLEPREGEHLALTLRSGYASADGDPDDTRSRDFTFDRDFDVGAILFDELMGGVEAATHVLLSDPENAGQAPDGVDATVTEGAFRRAVFLQPILELGPTSWLGLRGGLLLAWATGPVSQPFYTYRAGGTPTNHHDQPSEGSLLGTEFDWAITLGDQAVSDGPFVPALLVQGGHLYPGSPIAGGPNRIDLYTLTGRLRW